MLQAIVDVLRLVVLGALAVSTVFVALLVVLWAVRDLRRGMAPDLEAQLPPGERPVQPLDARKVIGRIGPGGRWA